MDITPRTIVFRSTGETTGEEYAGTFKVKPLLTHGEQVAIDSLRRDMLGTRSAEATPRSFNQATLISETAVRITESPSWWRDNQNGAGLYDDNVLAEVFRAVQKVEDDFRKELREKAAAAKGEIAKAELPK